MPLETGDYVSDLVVSNPPSTDMQSQGDDHLRLIKSILQKTFPDTGKAFRFPVDVAAKTDTYALAFPEDQNKIIPVNASGAARTVTLPSPAGVNANGWSVTIFKSDSSANLVTLAGTINGLTNYYLRKQYAGVKLIYSASLAAWIAFPLQTEFPATTRLLFQQTTPPAGWTKVTDSSYNDRALRMVTGTASTGGTTNFSSVFAARTISQANLPNITLTTSVNGSHSHGYIAPSTTQVGSDGNGAQAYRVNLNTDAAGDHQHTAPLGGSGTAMDFSVKYVDIIVAVKD